MLLRRFVVLLVALLPFAAFSAEQQQGGGMTVKQFEATLHYKQGAIALPGHPGQFRVLA